ncbi:MAG: glycine cleavage system protein GcvH [Clostridia bacterium]|nr:glycine cleavage system protein GcvH [Clostridia bacterium]
MNFPKELKYSKTHEWVRFQEDGTAYIGITDYAQDQLGDLVFVNLPAAGDALQAGESFADVESVKAVSDVNAPVSGTVKEVNEALADAPEKMNEAPYDAWFVLAEGITDTDALMTAEEYEAFIAEEGRSA